MISMIPCVVFPDETVQCFSIFGALHLVFIVSLSFVTRRTNTTYKYVKIYLHENQSNKNNQKKKAYLCHQEIHHQCIHIMSTQFDIIKLRFPLFLAQFSSIRRRCRYHFNIHNNNRLLFSLSIYLSFHRPK